MATRTKAGRPGRRKQVMIWAAVLSLVIAELLFYTWCRVQCVGTGYLIAQESRKQQELTRFQNNLKIELARLKAPEAISRIARNKLSLAMPDPQQIVVVP
ncbi:MAG: cell division protein FtsL [Desulfatitalea sp.]